MARNVLIKKVHECDNIYYYGISENNENEYDFFIGIAPAKKIIYFFKNTDFSIPLEIVNLNISSIIQPIEGLKIGVTRLAVAMAYKAILKNEFPEHLGFSS